MEKLIQELPFPLSQLLQNFVRVQNFALHKVSPFRFLEISFATTRFLSCIFLAEYLQEEHEDAGRHNRYILNALEKPTDGVWVSLLEYLDKIIVENNVLSQKISTLLHFKIEEKSLIEILKKNVDLRNEIVHHYEKIDVLKVTKQLKQNIKSLTPLWKLLSTYQLKNADGHLLNGLPPFFTATSDNEQTLYLCHNDTCLLLSPWLCSSTTQDIFFYNKKQRFSFISYTEQIPHVNNDMLDMCIKTFQRLEQNAMPKRNESQRDVSLDFLHICSFHEANFVGREDVLATMEKFIFEKTGIYGIITGNAGIGKTALLAYLYKDNMQKEIEKKYVWHFCAHAEERDNAQIFFRSFLAQVYKKYPKFKREIPFEVKKLQFEWQQVLTRISNSLADNEKFVFVIDALDESLLSNQQESIPYLLPSNLPKGIIGLLSVRKDLEHLIPFDRLYKTEKIVHLEKLGKENILELLKKLDIAEEKISPQIINIIWENSSHGDPFYLRFMADAIRSESVNIENIALMPSSLEGFFEESWITLPTEEDFLSYRILGLLATMQTSANDIMFAEMLNRSENVIAQIRLKLSKLLVMSHNDYSIFHQKFLHYVQQKFTEIDLVNFHKLLLAHYDIKDASGFRKVDFFSKDALKYVVYHAYHSAQIDKNFTTVYELLKDASLMEKKKKEATQVALDDCKYAIQAASIEAKDDKKCFPLLVKYATQYNMMVYESCKEIPKTIALYIAKEDYDSALAEAQLLTSEEERFYQYLILGISTYQKNLHEQQSYVQGELKNLPLLEMNYNTISLFSTFAKECIDKESMSFLEIIPHNANAMFWKKIIKYAVQKKCNMSLIQEIGLALSTDRELILSSLLDNTSISVEVDDIWFSFFDKNIKDSYLFSLALLHSNSQKVMKEIYLLLADIKDTQKRAQIVSLLIQKVEDIDLLDDLVYFISQIEDEGVKLQLASELIIYKKEMLEKHKNVFEEWLKISTSPIKRFCLDVAMFLWKNKNIEKNWLYLDEITSKLGENKDHKEVKKLIDIAKILKLVEDQDVREDIASKIVSEIYKIINKFLRNEIMLAVVISFNEIKLFSESSQLCEQLLYAGKILQKNRSEHFEKTLKQINYLPQEKQEHLYEIFWQREYFSNRMLTKSLVFLLENVPKNNEKKLLTFIENLETIPASSFYYICNWLQEVDNLEISLWYTIAKKNTASHLFHLGELAHYKGQYEQSLRWMLEAQELMLQKTESITYVQSKYVCISKGKDMSILAKNEWQGQLFSGLLEKNYEISIRHLEASIKNIVKLENNVARYDAMRYWLREILPLKEVGRYRSSLQVFLNHMFTFDYFFEKKILLIDVSNILKTLEKEKDIRNFFHALQNNISENIDDNVEKQKLLSQVAHILHKKQIPDAQEYVTNLWYELDSEKEPIRALALLRCLRPFGRTKKIKEYAEPFFTQINQEKNLVVRSHLLKHLLATLNGIETATRIQNLFGRILATIVQIDDIEKRKQLVDLTGMLWKMEEFGHMKEIWQYLPRMINIATEIKDPYQRALAHVQMGSRLLPNKPEEALHSIKKATPLILLVKNLYQKSNLCAQLAKAMKESNHYQKCIEYVSHIPIFNKRLQTLRELIPQMPYKWQLEIIQLSVADKATLDYVMATTIDENITEDICHKIVL